MDWQQVASLTIVAGTTVLLITRELRRRARASRRPCGGSCECSSGKKMTVEAKQSSL